MLQERNEHDLMKDFADEVPGYLNNAAIAQVLADLNLASGILAIPNNTRVCYQALVRLGVLDENELRLVDAWLKDVQDIGM